MYFDRFNDEPMIGDSQDGWAANAPELRDCKQCGESFRLDCHAAIEEEFCSDECIMMYDDVAIETKNE